MRNLLRIISPILNLLLYIELLVMVITCTTTQYPIMIKFILGIWTTNCLIPPTDAGLIGGHRRTRERYESLLLRSFPTENLILTHYMLSAWWLHIMNGLGNYVIRPGEIEQVLVMNNNITKLGYTYAKRRIKNPPDIFCKISHTNGLIA